MHWFEDFETSHFDVNGARIFARVSRGAQGPRPALLLLHGFPQSHVMWHRVATRLQQDFYLVLPDLRGYGDSSKAPGLPDHGNYSKRTMAQDMVAVMDALGVDRFFLSGHDRGGRVAHRLALDHPARVQKLCVIDIAPTLDMYQGNWGQSPNTSLLGSDPDYPAPYFEFAKAYYHWFHLIQPAPLPETMIGGKPLAYLHAKLGGWGSTSLDYIEPAALAEYERCFIQTETIHAMCEDYRASASIDLDHDRASRAQGQKIACDMLVLWGARGVVQRLFKPLVLWQAQCAGQVTGQAVAAGHYLPEELPIETAAQLRQFFATPVL
jgi:haloacetate dehalogenase